MANTMRASMKLERKPESWLCLATSFAMALGISTEVFCDIAGHDGGEIVFPDLPDPLCRRGFHIMEAIFVAMRCGASVTPVQLMPVIRSTPIAGAETAKETVVNYHFNVTSDPTENNWRYFQDFIAAHTGVIECSTPRGRQHAVAFQFDHIFDPDGRSFPYSREGCENRGLFTTCLWIVNPL